MEDIRYTSQQIYKLSVNYAKDSDLRKTEVYLKKREESLEEYWNEFCNLTEDCDIAEIEEIKQQTAAQYTSLIKDIRARLEVHRASTAAEELASNVGTSEPASVHPEAAAAVPSSSQVDTSAPVSASASSPAPIPLVIPFSNITGNQVHSNMPLDMNLALRFIPEYDGSKSCSVIQFISCCDALYTPLTTDNDQKQFTNILHCKLRARAYTILEYNPTYKWPNIKIELQKQFLDNRTYEGILSDLLNCAQNKLTVLEFANKVDRLKCDLNSACSQILGADDAIPVRKLNERVALKGFEDGLKPGLKLLVKARAFKSLQEASAYAVAEDKQFTDTHYSHKSNHSYSAPTNKVTVKQESKESLQNTKLYCKYCKKKGHSLQNCRKKPTSSGNSTAGQSSTENTVPVPKIN